MKQDTETFESHMEFLRTQVNQALGKLTFPEEPAYLYEPIQYVLKGKGKRLRPILVHLVGRSFDANPEDMLSAGMAVELLHNFTLVHDDIMDQDELRHGFPTVYRNWDDSTAILAGDGLYALAQLLVCRIGADCSAALRIFNQATLEVCEGQAFDKEYEQNQGVTLDQYLNMIEKKTGALLGLCSELGGILGGQDKVVREKLRIYGLNLGKAFQIQDDILEIFGDAGSMGKSLGSDLMTGKQTALVIQARAHDPETWERIWTSMGNRTSQEVLPAIRDYFREQSILDEVQILARSFVDKALENLEVIQDAYRSELEYFTNKVLDRKN